MPTRTVPLLLLLALGAVLPARAQSDECNSVDLPEVDEQYQAAGEMLYIQGPFLVRCASGAELRANQGTLNQLTRELLLVGNVRYQDATRSLLADQATYTSTIRRLYSTGNVVFTDRVEGMTIRGPELEYFATMPGRPEAQVNASQRPHLTVQPKQPSSPARKAEPLEVDADRMTILGKNDLSAFGSVVIKRTDLDATAEEARYSGATESLELRRNAVIKGTDNVLRGEVIQAQLRENALEDVRARSKAVLESKDLTVTAPDLHLFFKDELIQRSVARTSPDAKGERPIALSRTYRLEADSIDALAPAQKLDRVIAVGNARGETIDTTRAAQTSAPAAAGAAPPAAADTSRARSQQTQQTPSELISKDWIVGDTIIGFFAPDTTGTAGQDTAVVLERLVARGAARSLYRIQDQDSAGGAQPAAGARRAINFVSAEVISLRFKEGEVDVAELTRPRRGLYLDPAPPAPPAAGTTAGSTPATPPTPERE